jgi:hypothetical protein
MDVQELHVGAFGSNRHYVGWIWMERIDAYTCLAGFETMHITQHAGPWKIPA